VALHRDELTRLQSRSKAAVLPTRVPARNAKRVVDIVLAAIGLLVLSPLVAIVAVAIKLDSHGPILCRETRYGYARRVIRAFKFRSVATCANNDQTSSCVTRVGRVLRQTGIDELPQLLNVLCGDMSIVGPSAFRNRQDLLGRHSTPLLEEFSPGMTGRAQLIEARKGLMTAERRITEDLRYVDNWSLLLDFKIILMTILPITAAARVTAGAVSNSPESQKRHQRDHDLLC
jgi:lipopolysaccharide/colanic/teichoic acid biosynthesis glycosyltransferase